MPWIPELVVVGTMEGKPTTAMQVPGRTVTVWAPAPLSRAQYGWRLVAYSTITLFAGISIMFLPVFLAPFAGLVLSIVACMALVAGGLWLRAHRSRIPIRVGGGRLTVGSIHVDVTQVTSLKVVPHIAGYSPDGTPLPGGYRVLLEPTGDELGRFYDEKLATRFADTVRGLLHL